MNFVSRRGVQPTQNILNKASFAEPASLIIHQIFISNLEWADHHIRVVFQQSITWRFQFGWCNMNDLLTPETTATNNVAQNIEGEIQNWLQALTPETTFGGLLSYDVPLSHEVLTQVVDRQLGSSHHLPGSVVAEVATLRGMNSRPTLLAQLSRTFGRELCLRRPNRLLVEAESTAPRDHELFREVAELLIQFAPEWLENLQERFSESDLPSVRRIANTLKNSADNVGGRIANHALSEIENAAANGSLDEVVSNWSQCRTHFLHRLKSVEEFLGKNDKNTVGEADPGLGTPFAMIAGR